MAKIVTQTDMLYTHDHMLVELLLDCQELPQHCGTDIQGRTKYLPEVCQSGLGKECQGESTRVTRDNRKKCQVVWCHAVGQAD